MPGSSYIFPKNQTVTEVIVYGAKVAPTNVPGVLNWTYKSETKAVIISVQLGNEFEISILQ